MESEDRPAWGPRKQRKTKGGGHPNRRRLKEARTDVERRRSATRLDVMPIDAIQEVLDSLTADLRLSQKMVDGLKEEDLWRDTMVGKLPNEWIRLRDEYRDKLATLAGSMIARGIAEKAVNVRAAQAALMATMVKEALVRAGADPTMVQRVGVELRQLAQESQEGRG